MEKNILLERKAGAQPKERRPNQVKKVARNSHKTKGGGKTPPTKSSDWDNLPETEISDLPESKVSFDATKKDVPSTQESSAMFSAIVKVKEAHYVPKGFEVRSRIDEEMFTANFDEASLEVAQSDPKVVSISPAKRLFLTEEATPPKKEQQSKTTPSARRRAPSSR